MKIDELIKERGQSIQSLKYFLLGLAEFYDVKTVQPLTSLAIDLADTLELDIVHFGSDWFKREKPANPRDPVKVKSLQLDNVDDRTRVVTVLSLEHILSDESDVPPDYIMERAMEMEALTREDVQKDAAALYMEWIT